VDIAVVAPVAFVIGVGVGLLASSWWRVVRRSEYDRWRKNGT
jgi:hypothetical protein